MAEYIDREALCYQLAKQATIDGQPRAIKRAAKIVADFPAADVRPVVKAVWKHVQWAVDEEWQEGGYWISRCSNCSMPYHTETPFCPHCGADMREES